MSIRTSVDGSRAYRVDSDDGLSRLWIVENSELERLLFNRQLTGVEFREACLRSTRLLLRHATDLLAAHDWSELIVLSKGMIYGVGHAAAVEQRINLPTNVVATARLSVESSSASVAVPYARFDGGGSSLVIGDTIASGATITAAIDLYHAIHPVERLLVLSFAGSAVGAKRIEEYCLERQIDLHLLFGLAAFGLGSNGFDLSFLHPSTICDERYRELAERVFEGRQVSSVGWDFGTQCMAPAKYCALSWLEAQVLDMESSAVFSHAVRPEDWHVVAREASAYSSARPDLPVQVPLESW